jgi:hypothetical protein
METHRREYLRIYFGKSTDYYLNVLDKSEGGKKHMFNIAAFFLGPIWMLYRKMYVEAGFYLGGVIVLGFAEGFLVNEVFQLSPSAADTVSRSINIGLAMSVGMLANSLYIKKAIAAVDLLVEDWQEDGPDLVLEDQLRKMGGVSWPSALLGAAVVLALLVAYVYYAIAGL